MKRIISIDYKFGKSQTIEIEEKNEVARLELSHFEKETFFSTLLKGKMTLVTMVYYSQRLHKITKFYVFAKYPGKNKYEFIKSYRASDRARIVLGGLK